ncbi:MAG TPA: hypothetical protein VK430_11670 [Xanthobacteraceae bacterium]|nr:hypothetical protein [Xanthobacteraceae bacterium]
MMGPVNARTPLLAKLLAVQLVMLGGAAVDAASAQDFAPVEVQTEGGTGPIDTNLSIPGPSKSRHSLKMHDWRGPKTVHASGNFSDRHRNWTRGAWVGVMRNAIGLSVRQVKVDNKATDVKFIDRPVVEGRPNGTGPAGNRGVDAVAPDLHRRAFVPLPAVGGRPHDLRINTALNHSMINGRDMVRPGSGGSAIGGAPKIVAGVINGTNFRPRHP